MALLVHDVLSSKTEGPINANTPGELLRKAKALCKSHNNTYDIESIVENGTSATVWEDGNWTQQGKILLPR